MAAGKPKKEAAPAAPLVPLKDADFRKLLKTDVSGGFLFFALVGLPVAGAFGRIVLRGKKAKGGEG